MAALAALLAGCAAVSPPPSRPSVAREAPAPAPAAAPPPAGEPYAGFVPVPRADGSLEVQGVWPGPAAIAGLAAGDRILAVDGAPASGLVQRIADGRPGDVLALEVERNGVRHPVSLVLGRRAAWRAPSALPAQLPLPAAPRPDAKRPAARARAALGTLPGDLEQVEAALAEAFAALAERGGGAHTLPAVRVALGGGPQTLDTVARDVAREALAAASDPVQAGVLFCAALAIDCPRAAPAAAGDVAALVTALDTAEARVADAFAATGRTRNAVLADTAWLVEQTAAGRGIHAQAEAARALAAMQAALALDFPALHAALRGLLPFASHDFDGAAGTVDPNLPEGLATGEILFAQRAHSGYVLVGGAGANRYDMTRVAAVVDTGGDDAYTWGEAAPAVQFVLDTQGADRYEAAYGGPGAGWGGVAVLVDRAGDDRYRSVFGGCGAGVLGFGVLVDAAGDDVYRCDAWSLGAGLYGGGLLLDADGADVYLAQILSQGAGGPRGVGMLVDSAGADLYRANGLVASAYGTPGVYQGFSQGVGVGVRPLDTGGLGLLLDAGGDDRYEAGEFSQGGGYFWGLGLLRDLAGDDLYYGNRYAQGFAAHQAAGQLYDAAGDDLYWSMTAAGQAAAWDQGLAVLEDAAGDDTYRAGALSQGAAAHQSQAWLLEAAGDDRYHANGAHAQGAAGPNDYHYEDAAPVFSLGVLIDGDGADTYSAGATNGETRTNEAAGPAGQGRAGVLVDRP